MKPNIIKSLHLGEAGHLSMFIISKVALDSIGDYSYFGSTLLVTYTMFCFVI